MTKDEITEDRWKRRLLHLIKAGWSIEKIKREVNISKKFVNTFFAKKKTPADFFEPEVYGICMGSKTEAYYNGSIYSEDYLANNFPPEYNFEDLSTSELTFYNKVNNMPHKDNPNYQNGHFWGRKTVTIIESTTYKSLESAITAKQNLLDDFEEHFNWNMDNKDYAETKGFLDAFKEALAEQTETDEQESNTDGGTG